MSSCPQPMKSPRTSSSKSKSSSSSSLPASLTDGQLSLLPDGTRKLKRLQRDGIIILIDQPNLETEMRRKKEKTKEGRDWRISYATLIKIISNGKNKSESCRRVLATYLVTSNQALQYFRPTQDYLHRHRITLVKSPDKRDKGTEKAVDCTLTRIMTQEFEGIEVLRLKGRQPPKRTFCIVAGDFDYVDVVLQARKTGCDVEIWFWNQLESFSKQWRRQKVKAMCQSERCGNFTIADLEDSVDELSRWQRSPPKLVVLKQREDKFCIEM